MASITKGSCCMESLRNRFFSRKQMLADDFQIEQDHLIGRRRLVNREVLGSGVVQGYRMDPGKPLSCARDEANDGDNTAARSIHVGPGLALDDSGREVVHTGTVELTAENTFMLVKTSGVWCARDIDANMKPGKYVLAAHYAERGAGDTVPSHPCGCGDAERTHLCETVLFSLRWLGDDRCPCGEKRCPNSKECVTDGCADRSSRHARLVSWATNRKPRGVSPLRQWSDHDVALDDAVDLACVEIVGPPDKCRPLEATSVDAGSPRRVLKTNDTLFDLMRGCDLTRITEVSWAPWHRKDAPMDWSTFADFFTSEPIGENSLLTRFKVRFSGPVMVETLRPDVISITIHMPDAGTGWIRSRRIPLTRLDLTASGEAPLPDNTTDQLFVAVGKRWVRDEIDQGGESHLSERDFVVEIEVRGDLIRSCSGQSIDANAVGLEAAPSGNGTPGGTYFSSFKVKRMKHADEPT